MVSGTASASLSGFGRPAAGKTGTTEFNDNAWFVGFTPQLSTAVWLGHLDGNRQLTGFGSGRVFGGTVPAQAWKAFMRAALEGQPVLDFPKPGPLPVGGVQEAGGLLDPAARRPHTMPVPDLPQNCGGPCRVTPSLTTPTTAPPTTVPADTTTSPPTTAGTTTTTKKGQSP